MGLVDNLRQSGTIAEINDLLEQGKTRYSDASPKTKRRWQYVASRRLKELQLQAEQKAASEKKAEKQTKGKKARA